MTLSTGDILAKVERKQYGDARDGDFAIVTGESQRTFEVLSTSTYVKNGRTYVSVILGVID